MLPSIVEGEPAALNYVSVLGMYAAHPDAVETPGYIAVWGTLCAPGRQAGPRMSRNLV
jgi:hypothetical protein